MRKIFFLPVAAFLFLLVSWRLRPIWISNYQLSPQHTVNPKTITSIVDPFANEAVFNNKSITALPVKEEIESDKKTAILGQTSEHKRIEIDLTNQRIYAFEGANKVYDFLISSGKWGRTPTGVYRIWIKLRATKMEGGKKELGTYYYLPNVPYVMYFFNNNIPKWRGYGIHGTYWHSNFGHPMSHGCINMKTEEAQQLYYWANPNLNGKQSIWASDDNLGTEVIIYGEAPWE